MGESRLRVSREEIVAGVRGLAAIYGERVGIKLFCLETGVPESQVYEHFRSWGEVREAAGLARRPGGVRRFSDDDCFAELDRVARSLGRFPRWHEFSRLAAMGWEVLHRRFGAKKAIEREYRRWLGRQPGIERRKAELEELSARTAEPERDVRWMREKWFSLRVGFELKSSEFEGRRPDECDLLVVLEHDWKLCPVRVIELRAVVWEEGRRAER
jgi:hypothetical protein